MIIGLLRKNEKFGRRLLLAGVGVLALLTAHKLWGYHSSKSRAANVISKAVDRDKGDPEQVKKYLAGSTEIANEIKKKNLFVPIPPKRHPVSAVLGIMGSEALINGKWYKVGDKIGDAKVVSVEPTQVKIEWEGKEKIFAPIAASGGATASSSRGGPGRGGDSRGPRPDRGSMPGPGGERRFGPPGFENMSEEQRAQMRARMEGMRARFESMSPEEREKFRNEMRERHGGRGPGGPGGMGGGRGGFDGGRGGRR